MCFRRKLQLSQSWPNIHQRSSILLHDRFHSGHHFGYVIVHNILARGNVLQAFRRKTCFNHHPFASWWWMRMQEKCFQKKIKFVFFPSLSLPLLLFPHPPRCTHKKTTKNSGMQFRLGSWLVRILQFKTVYRLLVCDMRHVCAHRKVLSYIAALPNYRFAIMVAFNMRLWSSITLPKAFNILRHWVVASHAIEHHQNSGSGKHNQLSIQSRPCWTSAFSWFVLTGRISDAINTFANMHQHSECIDE